MARRRRNARTRMVAIRTEQENREQLLPEGLGPWDRFWYGVVGVLARAQELILRHVLREHCWRSQDGQVRTLRQLGDRHLSNAIGVLERTGDPNGKLEHLYRERFRRHIEEMDR